MKNSRTKKRHNTKERLFVIFLIVVAVFAGLIPLFLYKVQQILIDLCLGVDISVDLNIVELLVVFLVTVLIQLVLIYIKDRVCAKHVINKAYQVEQTVKNKIVKLKYSDMENEKYTAMLSEVDALADNLETKYAALFSICMTCVYLSSCIYAVFTISIPTVIIVFCLLGIDIFLNIYCAVKTKGFWAKYMFATRKSNYFSAILTNREYATERKVLNTHDFVQGKFEQEFDVARASNIRLGKSRFKIETVSKLVSCVFSVAILLTMLPSLLSKSITLGTYCSLFFLLNSAIALIGTACAGVFEMGNAQHGLATVDKLLALPEENVTNCELGFFPTTVQFNNVSFSYPNTDKKILDDVSFSIDLTGKYAIVGENGCGKSTLVKLLLGLYQPDSGNICINGRRLETLGRENIISLLRACELK